VLAVSEGAAQTGALRENSREAATATAFSLESGAAG